MLEKTLVVYIATYVWLYVAIQTTRVFPPSQQTASYTDSCRWLLPMVCRMSKGTFKVAITKNKRRVFIDVVSHPRQRSGDRMDGWMDGHPMWRWYSPSIIAVRKWQLYGSWDNWKRNETPNKTNQPFGDGCALKPDEVARCIEINYI